LCCCCCGAVLEAKGAAWKGATAARSAAPTNFTCIAASREGREGVPAVVVSPSPFDDGVEARGSSDIVSAGVVTRPASSRKRAGRRALRRGDKPAPEKGEAPQVAEPSSTKASELDSAPASAPAENSARAPLQLLPPPPAAKEGARVRRARASSLLPAGGARASLGPSHQKRRQRKRASQTPDGPTSNARQGAPFTFGSQ